MLLKRLSMLKVCARPHSKLRKPKSLRVVLKLLGNCDLSRFENWC